ncbi:hypothetical protein FACS189456_1960 [Bacteroidia bacterium]|nr:hypothetical protein FACS189456_1960 [Bacteroidia bacterium]
MAASLPGFNAVKFGGDKIKGFVSAIVPKIIVTRRVFVVVAKWDGGVYQINAVVALLFGSIA